MSDVDRQIKSGDAPSWMTAEGFRMLSQSYMLPGETPRKMYERIAKAAGSYFRNSKVWSSKFFDVMWKNWLCPASPVLANMGTTRGLPISCNSIHVDDSIDSIFSKVHELAILSKHGAGVGIYLGDVRGRNKDITGNGKSEGTIPWAKVFDSTVVSVSQGATRRGAGALYLPVRHSDIDEFLQIRRQTGDVNRRCLNINHGVCISDEWMQTAIDGGVEERKLWGEILRTRVETGEPYMLFIDNVNKQNPECYTQNGLAVRTSNICTEIALHTDPEHSFVCCLSSLNLARWREWSETDLPSVAVRFLDAVLSEYIDKSDLIIGLGPSRASAVKGRAIGVGVLGWHTLLQQEGLPFDSFDAMALNSKVFRQIDREAKAESSLMAKELDEPLWCKGFGQRHTHLTAIAPTVSNSAISGGVSAGIEPIAANVYAVKSATGTFIRKNGQLEQLLESLGKNTDELWKSISAEAGSAQHLDVLSDEQKAVFLTAREISQHAIVRQAVQRQPFVDQAQSVNLFFAQNASPKYIHEVHLAAWQGGLKSLYYLRSDGVLRGDLASRSKDECTACEA